VSFKFGEKKKPIFKKNNYQLSRRIQNNIIMFPLFCPYQNPILLTQSAFITNLTQTRQETYFEICNGQFNQILLNFAPSNPLNI